MTTLVSIVEILKAIYLPEAGNSLAQLWAAISVLLIWHWVYFDATNQKFHRPFSFGMCIQVYWYLAVPWYCIKTRGLKGLLIPVGFLFLLMAPEFFRAMTYDL